jgi:phospholipid transport system substrate-binding protein
MPISSIPTKIDRAQPGLHLARRSFLAGLGASAGAVALGVRPAGAFTVDEARQLIDAVVRDVNAIIASGKDEPAMLRDFEALFARYADVPTIARSALGPAARTASNAELQGFTLAFQGYIARKYGRRFREFIGGAIEVTDARPLRSYFEVVSIARLRGRSPFDLRWHVSDRGGRPMFFNLIIEGVNMLAAERTEIQAMLEQRRGSIAGLTADLNAL